MKLEYQVVPKLGIWLSKKFLSRDCPSDICPSPKRFKDLCSMGLEISVFVSRDSKSHAIPVPLPIPEDDSSETDLY